MGGRRSTKTKNNTKYSRNFRSDISKRVKETQKERRMHGGDDSGRGKGVHEGYPKEYFNFDKRKNRLND